MYYCSNFSYFLSWSRLYVESKSTIELVDWKNRKEEALFIDFLTTLPRTLISTCETTVLLIGVCLISSSQTNKFLPWISLRVSPHLSLGLAFCVFQLERLKERYTYQESFQLIGGYDVWKFSQFSTLSVGWYIYLSIYHSHTQNFIPFKVFQNPKPGSSLRT